MINNFDLPLPLTGIDTSNPEGTYWGSGSTLTYHFPSRGLKRRIGFVIVLELSLWLTTSPHGDWNSHFIHRKVDWFEVLWLTTSPHGDWNFLQPDSGKAIIFFDLPLPLTGIETLRNKQSVIELPWSFDLPLPLTGIETCCSILVFNLNFVLWLTTSPHGDWNSVVSCDWLTDVGSLTYHFPSRGLKRQPQLGLTLKQFLLWLTTSPHGDWNKLQHIVKSKLSTTLTYHFPSRGLKQAQ